MIIHSLSLLNQIPISKITFFFHKKRQEEAKKMFLEVAGKESD